MQARQYIKEQLISVLLEQNGIEDKKIKNPDTGREIKISSALSYDKDSSVFKKAKAFISKLFGKHHRGSPDNTEPKSIESGVSRDWSENYKITDLFKREINNNPREFFEKAETQRKYILRVLNNKKTTKEKLEWLKYSNNQIASQVSGAQNELKWKLEQYANGSNKKLTVDDIANSYKNIETGERLYNQFKHIEKKIINSNLNTI